MGRNGGVIDWIFLIFIGLGLSSYDVVGFSVDFMDLVFWSAPLGFFYFLVMELGKTGVTEKKSDIVNPIFTSLFVFFGLGFINSMGWSVADKYGKIGEYGIIRAGEIAPYYCVVMMILLLVLGYKENKEKDKID